MRVAHSTRPYLPRVRCNADWLAVPGERGCPYCQPGLRARGAGMPHPTDGVKGTLGPGNQGLRSEPLTPHALLDLTWLCFMSRQWPFQDLPGHSYARSGAIRLSMNLARGCQDSNLNLGVTPVPPLLTPHPLPQLARPRPALGCVHPQDFTTQASFLLRPSRRVCQAVFRA